MTGLERIEAVFHRCRKEGHAAFMPYHAMGYPSREKTLKIIHTLSEVGADLFEIGIPHSDPLADGPTIQTATYTALMQGTTVKDCLAMVRELRAMGVDQPFCAMSYYNPIFAYGVERFVEDAATAGVDGLILVCVGAGGHAGRLSPFALVPEVRRFYDGTVILSGSIASGGAIAATLALGADLAYIGTRFIASTEANAPAAYKEMIEKSTAEDIVYTNLFTGVHGNYLKASIVAAGLDPDHLPESDKTRMDFGSGSAKAKAWRDIWGAGQGVGQIDATLPAAQIVERLARRSAEAGRRFAACEGLGRRIEQARGGEAQRGAGFARSPNVDQPMQHVLLHLQSQLITGRSGRSGFPAAEAPAVVANDGLDRGKQLG